MACCHEPLYDKRNDLHRLRYRLRRFEPGSMRKARRLRFGKASNQCLPHERPYYIVREPNTVNRQVWSVHQWVVWASRLHWKTACPGQIWAACFFSYMSILRYRSHFHTKPTASQTVGMDTKRFTAEAGYSNYFCRPDCSVQNVAWCACFKVSALAQHRAKAHKKARSMVFASSSFSANPHHLRQTPFRLFFGNFFSFVKLFHASA